jgi:protein tyrosine phosphatase
MSKPASSTPSLPEEEIEFFFAALQATTNPSKPASPDGAVALIRKRKLDDALDKFRMTATNVSTSSEVLRATRLNLMECLSECGYLENTFNLFNSRMDSLKAEEEAKKQSSGKFLYVQTKMQEVVKNLWIGSWHPASDADLLKSSGVTHICCCINVKPRLQDKGWECAMFPAEDNDTYDISQHFDESFTFIDGALMKGTGVLVHCGAGISRAATILAAYLIRKLRISAQDAVEMIQRKRQVARPNQNFMKQLKAFAEKSVKIIE